MTICQIIEVLDEWRQVLLKQNSLDVLGGATVVLDYREEILAPYIMVATGICGDNFT